MHIFTAFSHLKFEFHTFAFTYNNENIICMRNTYSHVKITLPTRARWKCLCKDIQGDCTTIYSYKVPYIGIVSFILYTCGNFVLYIAPFFNNQAQGRSHRYGTRWSSLNCATFRRALFISRFWLLC